MIINRRLPVLLLAAAAALLVSALPALGAPPTPATEGIDDPGGDDAAPGVNVIREVGASGSVVVRLNLGNRHAHFNVIVRGVDVVAIDDDFSRKNGVDGGHVDGIWGGCQDELRTRFAKAVGKKGLVAQAKLYTCNQHDSIRLHLGAPKIGKGSFPAIKIVFTQGVLDNTEGVFVGEDATNVGNSWIPLFG